MPGGVNIILTHEHRIARDVLLHELDHEVKSLTYNVAITMPGNERWILVCSPERRFRVLGYNVKRLVLVHHARTPHWVHDYASELRQRNPDMKVDVL